jgi:hypothetical protein
MCGLGLSGWFQVTLQPDAHHCHNENQAMTGIQLEEFVEYVTIHVIAQTVAGNSILSRTGSCRSLAFKF